MPSKNVTNLWDLFIHIWTLILVVSLSVDMIMNWLEKVSVIKYGTGLLTTHEFHRPIGNSRIRVFQFLGSLLFVSFIRDSWVIFVRDSWLLPKPKIFLTLSLFSFLVTCDIYIGIWCTFSVGNWKSSVVEMPSSGWEFLLL